MRELDRLLEFLRFPTISADPACATHLVDCAGWLDAGLRTMGLASQVYPTPGHPIVLARNQFHSSRRTVMLYGHYDVQPVDPLGEWHTPPFEPQVRNGIITARGATDNKGQIMAHLCGLGETLAAHRELPVNMIVLIEGEEEIGSAHLEEFLIAHRAELACDIVAISDTGMIAPGVPTFTYGLRGIVAMEITVRGASTDLHSGIYGGAVANPAMALARLLATMHDQEGRVAVPGFYDEVRPLESWEREAWASLPLTDLDILKVTGAPALVGEAGYRTLERTWGRPTAEVNGLGGGYQGEGSKTVIPKEAFAKLTFRLVPDQEPAAVSAAVRAHLQRNCPPGVTLEVRGGHGGQPYVMDPHSPDGTAAQRALRATFGGEVALIREGGSIPIVQTFKSVLGVETLLLGLALPDCRAHAPNENFPLENFVAGIRLNQRLLTELSLVS